VSLLQEITSRQNPRFRALQRALRREETPEGAPALAIAGPRLLAEALAAGWNPRLAAARLNGSAQARAALESNPAFAQAERYLLSPALFDSLGGATPSLQEPFVLLTPPPSLDPEDGLEALAAARRILVADGVQDPGNLGALLRSARAVGCDAVASTHGSASFVSAKVLRASAGALFHLRLSGGHDPSALAGVLSERGVALAALDSQGGEPLEQARWSEPLALVAGNEAHGVSGAWAARGARRLRISMAAGAESLNVAMAGAIALHAAWSSLEKAKKV